MMHLIEIEYANFQSAGNHPITIQLDQARTTVIGGANGSGKTTMNYALTYNLFGKMMSGLKISGAINTTNKKAMRTRSKFTKHGSTYEVVRGEKPKLFEIYKDGEQLDQRANARDQQKMLEAIIGMDFKLWCQLVVLNRERFVPFMDMGAAERRKVVEDILDIAIISNMNGVVKEMRDGTKTAERDLQREVDTLKTQAEGKRDLIDHIKREMQTADQSNQDEIDQLQQDLNEYHQKVEDLLASKPDVDSVRYNRLQHESTEYSKIASTFEYQRKTASDAARFFVDNDRCPTCEQSITEQLRTDKQMESERQVAQIDSNIEEMIPEVEKVHTELASLEQDREKACQVDVDIRILNGHITTAENQIERYKKQSNSSSKADTLQTAVSDLSDIERRLETKTDELESILDNNALLDEVKTMLSDQGIKSKIVHEYIDLINRKINEYLISMEFYIGMTLDENFNESFAAMHKESFVLDNLSTGQKARVNLAIWLALLEVAAIKNSVVTNVLFIDEILENLDDQGVPAFMRLVNDKLKDKNMFVVTQRFAEFQDHFESSIQFKLNHGFTEIV